MTINKAKAKSQGILASPVALVANVRDTHFPIVGMDASTGGLEDFDNINGGTIFLDGDLKIKRFTREVAQIYRLGSTELGRPLCDIKSNIQDENLFAEAQAVLDSLTPQEHEVRTVDGAWYLARIQPYRTLDNVIDGVVLTFTDISKLVAAEAAEKLALKLADGIVDTMREPLIVLDENLKIISASRSFYRDFQTTPEDTVGRPIYSLGNHQWDIPNYANYGKISCRTIRASKAMKWNTTSPLLAIAACYSTPVPHRR